MSTPGEHERDAGPSQEPERPRGEWAALSRALAVTGDRWTLVIVLELASGRTRLSALRERLSGISAGVLDRHVRRMGQSGLLTRTRFREMPPRVELELTEAGEELLPIAGALGEWGTRFAPVCDGQPPVRRSEDSPEPDDSRRLPVRRSPH